MGHCSVNIFVGGHYGWWHMLLGVSSCEQMPAWHLLGALATKWSDPTHNASSNLVTVVPMGGEGCVTTIRRVLDSMCVQLWMKYTVELHTTISSSLRKILTQFMLLGKSPLTLHLFTCGEGEPSQQFLLLITDGYPYHL